MNFNRKYAILILGLIGLLILIEISIRTQTTISKQLFNLSLPILIKKNLASYLGFTFAVLPLFLFEILLPNDEKSKDHGHGVLFWIISIQANFFYSLLSLEIIQFFNIKPLFNISFESFKDQIAVNPLITNIFLIVITLLIFDFFYYWFHRMQHKIGFLWEFHKVHHSIKNLNSVVSYHHVLEELFRIPFIIIPLAILIKIDAPKLAILSSFYAVYGQFIHTNTKVSLGFLRHIFADNYYHRIHHSLENKHFDKNFAAFFPIWDMIFRTNYFPKNGEFPEVGLADLEQPKTLKSYLFLPDIFHKKK